ncbi:MAG: hypothetical protein MOB07_20500 [Acidobacteria bacterium]|nr:hypothetical protein [Acidobacteriota bacterium]
MTAHSIKLTLLLALWSFWLTGIIVGVALANTDNKGLVSSPGAIRPEHYRGGESFTRIQDSRPRQTQQPASPGKRKSLHEYGPEELFPEAQENVNTRPRKNPARQPEASKVAPLVTKPAVTPTAVPNPTVTPTAMPNPTVTPTAVPELTVTQTPSPTRSTVPAAVTMPSETTKANGSGILQQKLLVRSILFLLFLLVLVFVLIKMRRQWRKDREIQMVPISHEQRSATGRKQLSTDGQAAAAAHVQRSKKPTRRMKNKMRNEINPG